MSDRRIRYGSQPRQTPSEGEYTQVLEGNTVRWVFTPKRRLWRSWLLAAAQVITDSGSTALDAIMPVTRRVRALKGVLPRALPTALALARGLDRARRQPDTVDVSVDGSVMAYVYGAEKLPGGGHRRYAVFEASEGGLAFLLKDRVDGSVKATNVEAAAEIDDAISEAYEFVAS